MYELENILVEEEDDYIVIEVWNSKENHPEEFYIEYSYYGELILPDELESLRDEIEERLGE
jgi:hypothetical protein